MRNIIIIMSTLILLLSGTALFAAGNKNPVDYPEGYRVWAHVKSMVIEEGHPLYDPFGGFHHIYANGMALKPMKAGEPYPDGAVLIFDLLEAKNADHAVVEGPRKLVGVMQKDSRKFADTGGWGFEGFRGDTRERMVSDPKNACFACHESQTQADYVFSRYRK